MRSGVKPRVTNRIEDMHIPPDARKFVEQTMGEMQNVSPEEFMGTTPERIEPIPFVPDECRYEIGERVYVQRKPKLMQQRQLLNVLRQSKIDFGAVSFEPSKAGLDSVLDQLLGLGINAILGLLGDAIPAALAIILCPEGVALQDKDLSEIQQHLEANLDWDQEVEIAVDFFDYAKVVRAKAEARLAERQARLTAHQAARKT